MVVFCILETSRLLGLRLRTLRHKVASPTEAMTSHGAWGSPVRAWQPTGGFKPTHPGVKVIHFLDSRDSSWDRSFTIVAFSLSSRLATRSYSSFRSDLS
ncbi:hypothetical protein PoB_002329100 [Plakobranchus ocellatus]|uniref:Secreted protein n=1 Tax=Plakobranchus ocellatus TaxID=259542 RepID=A0AAV3ZC31_9GAST|nr:hypothetical protein PoB_002329100 [Plakobranchus ocellatus]